MKKVTLWTIIIILVIVILLVLGIEMHRRLTISQEIEPMGGYAEITQEVSDIGWTLNITQVIGENDPSKIIYYLYNNTGVLEKGYLSWIRENSSPFNIIWHDLDNNYKLSANDIIFISKSGGNAGRARSGYVFTLITEKYNVGISHIVLE